MDVVIEKLALVPLLSDLDDDELHRVARVCERQFIAPGRTLVEAGSVPDAAYLCLDDAIASETLIDGEWQRTAVPEGGTLSELAMVVEIEAVSRLIAVDHARVIRIARARLIALLENDSDLAAALSANLTRRLIAMADQMREASVPFFLPSVADARAASDGGAATDEAPAEADEAEHARRSA